MKINGLPVDVKIFSLCYKDTPFQADFNSISRNCDPLFSQKNFDHTHFGEFCPGVFGIGGFCPGVYVCGGLCPRTVFNVGK